MNPNDIWAFPISVPDNFHEKAPGMTLRDYFAIRFAPELIKRNTGCGTVWERVASDAYKAADAMLKERLK